MSETANKICKQKETNKTLNRKIKIPWMCILTFTALCHFCGDIFFNDSINQIRNTSEHFT